MPKDCDSAPLGSSLLLLETLPRGHVLGQACLRWESLSVGFCFGVKAGSFIRSVSCQGIHQGLGVGKNCEDGGTGEKSSEKLRPVTLMFRARAADPESLCRPPSFGLGSVSYTIFWCTQAKVLQVTIQKWRHTVLSLCWADCAAMALKPGDQARGCFRPYYLLFTLILHAPASLSCLVLATWISCPCQRTWSFISSQRVSGPVQFTVLCSRHRLETKESWNSEY